MNNRILIAHAAALASAAVAFADILPNGGFEELNVGGWAEGWRRGNCEAWSVARDGGTDGSAALVWECRDPDAPKSSVSRDVHLDQDCIYTIEADIRVEGALKGPYGKGALVYFEQFDANGKWLGGTYTEEIKATGGGWRHMGAASSPIRLKTVRVVAGLQVTKGCTGKVYFDNFAIRKFDIGSAPDPALVPYRYAPDRANTNRCVWIDAQRRARVCGKPFFPLGTYGGIGEKDIANFRGGPFNTIMAYEAPDRAALDRAAAHGLKVISGVNHVFADAKSAPEDVKTPDDERAWLKRYVSSVKDHPALLAWYSADEIPVTKLLQLVSRRDLLEELDPEHPVWWVMNNTALTRHYLPSFDVAGADPYPVYDGADISSSARWTRQTVQGCGGGRAAWMVPQIFSWSHYNRKGGVPTRDEIRNQTWQCIAEGATGIIYFKYGDLKNNADTGRTFEDRWADVTNVAWEVRRAIPLLLSETPAPAVSGTNATLCARAFQANGNIHLLVVNASRKPCKAKVKVELAWYPAYEAELAPLEVRMVDLTSLRPTIPLSRIGRKAWYAPDGWWERRHREKLAEIANGPKVYDMVFVGDSITHNWEGWKNPDEAAFIDDLHRKGKLKTGARPAGELWDQMAEKYRILNLGYGGDCTQHVLWRIENGELDGYVARNIMLMIGTNNAETELAVVNGVRCVVEAMRRKQPKARLLLSAIFPRQASPSHWQRQRNNRINRELKKLADAERIVWLDFNARFLSAEGVLGKSLFPDLLHPNAAGYDVWWNAIKGYLE